MPQCKDIIIDTFLSVKEKMNPNDRKHAFELFGFDFLLDEDFRVWLLEVNTNPFLGTPNEYMKTLVPEMIDDMCKLVIDPICPPRVVTSVDRPNQFELLWREEKEGQPGVN